MQKIKDIEIRMAKRGLFERIFIGIFMGISDLIPGLDGGTVVYIMGVYDETMIAFQKIWSPKSTIEDRIIGIKYYGVMILASFVGIYTFAAFIEIFLRINQNLIIALILGFIISGFLRGYNKVKKIPIKPRMYAVFIIPMIFVVSIGYLGNSMVIEEVNSVSQIPEYWMIFIIGLGLGIVLLIPGISAPLLGLVVGVYGSIIYIISNLLIIPLLILGAGILIGMLLCTNLITYLIKNHNTVFLVVNLGFLMGAIIVVFKMTIITNNPILTGFLIIIGFLLGKLIKEQKINK